MKKKKQKTSFDELVERLIQEFNKIPNFDLTRTDEVGNSVFNIIAYRIAEVSSYKDLVCQHFIPATNKAIFEGKKDFQNSRYKAFLKTKDIDFQETLYDTIRLAYVGLFHKLENYINDVVRIPELIFCEHLEKEETVAKWAKEKFQFDLKDWQQFYITHKINWICNCVKHKDGFPVKEPKPKFFQSIDETTRIRINPEEFKQDCEHLIKFYPIYLQTVFIFAQYKLLTERKLIKEEWEHSPDLYEKQVEELKEAENIVSNFINALKELK